MSGTAYTVYIVHPRIVVGWTFLFYHAPLPEIVKFVLVAPLNVVSCFAVAYAIRKLPFAKKVL